MEELQTPKLDHALSVLYQPGAQSSKKQAVELQSSPDGWLESSSVSRAEATERSLPPVRGRRCPPGLGFLGTGGRQACERNSCRCKMSNLFIFRPRIGVGSPETVECGKIVCHYVSPCQRQPRLQQVQYRGYKWLELLV